MASQLASFPNLRRTLTDVMEDELYPIPSHSKPLSPLLSNMFPNIPEYDHNNSTTSVHQYPEYSDQTYPFQTYANPDLYTTFPNYQFQQMLMTKNQESSKLYHPEPSTFAPIEAHLKLPEELMNDSKLYDTNEAGVPMFVFPKDGVMSMDHDYMSLVPDEVLDEELSDDDDEYLSDDDDEGYSEIQMPESNDDMTDYQPSTTHTKHNNANKGSSHNSSHDNNSEDMDISDYESSSRNVTATDHDSTHNGFGSEHQCRLTISSTGKPCLKQFSRPYDLIRHQETIHAERKKIFRCMICEEEALKRLQNNVNDGEHASNKTFSRGDALSRHIRVKHGLVGNAATEAIKYAKDNAEFV
ncbi:unnamed protein product [Kuraishia capsulata CBS 1993]|uniref:C2H2-type domain-containing protein n=1 Tax=Kuraishia capsulata CBS 1993 TaxID=1382522 RepID=W6MP81_9ASCO|nr:uncharacterized protein KUCA_T00004059001 [Kuraishia capsulata CBS 1993]CDK28078.1 unnamed protein product [Kuraishia capsulata CBS 1993]